MKTRVITRSFYEDAYLDFFIIYYISIGFDNIMILKADTEKEYEMDEYKLPDILTEDEKSRVTIINVKNTGNDILNDHFEKFIDDTYDWILNIDCDEFLILDWIKYPGGVNDYLNKYLNEIVDNKLMDDVNQVQQLKYRWVCITKLDNNWDKHDNTISGYINSYPLETYKYAKSFGSTKHMIKKNNKYTAINCHFYSTINMENEFKKLYEKTKNPNMKNRKYGWIADNKHALNNNVLIKNKLDYNSTFLYGYILHVNTRSLTNALTKTLVTKLREIKKIRNLDNFRKWINKLDENMLLEYNLNREKYNNEIENLKYILDNFLNNKSLFPKEIKKYHESVKNKVNMEKIYDLLVKKCLNSELLFNNKRKITDIPFCNIEIENKILKTLCEQKKINYDICCKVLSLY
jgi:hypothetical protein